jgi:transposase
MATKEEYEKLTIRERQQRYFSEEFKRRKVGDIDKNLITVAEVCREYQVSSTAVYRWIYKYSYMRKKGIRQVVEAKSDTRKLQLLKEQIKDLERVVGQKQLQIDFLSKMIDIAEDEYGVDIKKKFDRKRSDGTGLTGENIASK